MGSLKSEKNQLLIGSFVHSKTLDALEYRHDTAVCVDRTGKIVAIESGCDVEKAEKQLYPKLGWDPANVEVTRSKEGQFFFPGFIDTHIHAPQYPNAGIFGKSTLLDWLNTYTFPLEASLSNLSKAHRVYAQCVRRTLSHGTTTAAYYATIDVGATNLLADLCHTTGQRALVGRVCMDHPDTCPAYYRDIDAATLESQTRKSIKHIRSLDPSFALLSPILTPRFAPSCSRDALKRLGDLAAEMNLPVQTHISENAGELDLVRDMFPEFGGSYAGVYDAFGLLGERTVLAHAVHLSDGDAEIVARRKAGVAHCPVSNSALASGEARVRWLLERGIKVGLGSDVSGGYSVSILEAARHALLVSRHLAMPVVTGSHGQEDWKSEEDGEKEREKAKLSVEEVLYLATRGGAEVLGLQDRIGAFEVGMEFDSQLIGLNFVPEDGDDEEVEDIAEQGNVDVFGWETWEERIAKWLFNGDDRNTQRVWVKGRLVHLRM